MQQLQYATLFGPGSANVRPGAVTSAGQQGGNGARERRHVVAEQIDVQLMRLAPIIRLLTNLRTLALSWSCDSSPRPIVVERG